MEKIRQGDIPGVQIRTRQVLSLLPAQAWDWITAAHLLEQWLASEVTITDKGLELSSPEDDGSGGLETANTLDKVQGRLWVLAFTRPDSGWPAPMRLTLELAPHPEGCELSVLQEGFQQLSLTVCLTIWEAYRRRWRQALSRLATATSGT